MSQGNVIKIIDEKVDLKDLNRQGLYGDERRIGLETMEPQRIQDRSVSIS